MSGRKMWRGMQKAACFLVLAAGLSAPGCAWYVIPPAQVQDPVPVALTEYGRHTRLALPVEGQANAGAGKFIEYGFGDWDFYGREDRSVLSGLRALVGLGSGAFSRREMRGLPTFSMQDESRSAVLMVEKARVQKLRQILEARWEGNSLRVVRSWDGVPVSQDAQRYHLGHNSNAESAAWLRELGVEVKGHPILSNFRVQPSAQ